MKSLKLKKESRGVYYFFKNEVKVYVVRTYVQTINKKRDDVVSLFVGWGSSLDSFATFDTLRDVKLHFGLS